MVRKSSLIGLGLMAMLALATAPSAFAHADDPGCNGFDKDPHGIYAQSAGNVGKFKLTPSPTTNNTAAKLTGSALLCGTNPAEGDYFTAATLVYPNKGEFVTCARRNASLAVDKCDQNGDGVVNNVSENLSSGSYLGSATTDSYCTDYAVCTLAGIDQQNNIAAKTYVKTDADGNTHCDAASTTQIACEQTIAELVPDNDGDGVADVICKSDIIVNRNTPTAKYNLTIYQPVCVTDSGYTLSEVYVDNIDTLTICKKAGSVGGNTCDTTTKTVFKNGGAVSYTWNLSVSTEEGVEDGDLDSSELATASGSWT